MSIVINYGVKKLGIEAREIFMVGQSLREICPLKIKKKCTRPKGQI